MAKPQISNNQIFQELRSINKQLVGVNHRLDGVDKRFDGVDKRLGTLEKDMKTVKRELKTVKKNQNVLIDTFDNELIKHDKRLDKIEHQISISPVF
ncbi:MAG: hypothetical protein ABFQ62_05020 [Patescibacteria group bacterium]